MGWRRIKELVPTAVLFEDCITHNDIRQGDLGNCYFLGTVAAMAEFPEALDRMFFNRELNDAGCYLVYFWVNGVRTAVMVDDFLPTYYDT